MLNFFRTYLLPGLVIQSAIIGGGYATGRELVEFFLSLGPVGGFVAMAVATLIWSAVIAVSFELARRGRAYDYRTFIRSLLGPAWIAFELAYVVGVILVLSVVTAAAGQVLQDMFGLPLLGGALVVAALVGVTVYFGSNLIEKLLTSWAILVYIVYVALVIMCIAYFGDEIAAAMQQGAVTSEAFVSGVKYAAYNIGMVPALLFCIRHAERPSQALWAGALAGPIAMAPALFIYLSMLSHYPQILEQPIPTTFLFGQFDAPIVAFLFQIVLLGAIVDTGFSFVHGFNERIARELSDRGRKLSGFWRAAIGIGLLAAAVLLGSTFGLIDLIAQGYGSLTWLYLAVFVVPVLTLGLWRITRRSPKGPV